MDTRRPPLNNGSAQVLDDFIVNATTSYYASMEQSPPSTDPQNERLYGWYRFFLERFQNRSRYYEEVLCHGTQGAQDMLDVIQILLDVEWVNEEFKRILEVALLRLAQIYQLYPKSLLLDDVLHRNALLARNTAVRGTHNGKVVSVKISRSRSESSHLLIWTRLRHDNVLPVYGICTVARYDRRGQYIGVGLVSPFVKNGNVINYLKANPVADRQSFIFDVALGMSYLHENEVVHGRIHGQNILVTSTDPPRACLVDFGLAPVLPVDTRAAHFLAPELDVPSQNPPRTKASDVYAFSTASYEILTKPKSLQEEWSPWSNPFKPDDSGIDEPTWRLLLDSWQKDPDQRPRAGRIVERLDEMRNSRKLRMDRLESILITILKDREYYKKLLSCTIEDAQEVLDTFQLLLDTGNFKLEDRVQLIAAMRRLSERTELYPSRFFLNCPVPAAEDYPVASGGFADIYKVNVDLMDHDICVKVIRVPPQLHVEHITKMYAREVITWGQLSHSNVLPFYGLSRLVRPPRLCFVSRWAKNGNLNEYLARNPDADRTLLCLDTASGVEYLHKNNIVHGDLKGGNILIDSSGRACLGDFGLSSVTDPQIIKWTSQLTVASTGGTARWQAPELHRSETVDDKIHNSKASDVFAWACICYEAFTGQWPFHEIERDLSVLIAIVGGKTPTRPPEDDSAWSKHGLNDRIWGLMEHCWKFDPSKRPNMAAIISRLGEEKPVDSRPSGDWEEGASMRFRIAQGHRDNANLRKEITSLWDRLEDLLSRVVPGALEK